jgi:glyoxylase-like metal-dependent hydrolase (beta-lactamase superfamily II)
MANAAPEITRLSETLVTWQFYDLSVKAELHSTAVKTSAGILFVDPVPLDERPLRALTQNAPIAGVCVTNINHCRAANDFSEKFATPIWAHAATHAGCLSLSPQTISDGELICGDARVIEIPGGPAGEVAIYHADNSGLLIVGDALINFEPYGFAFLPKKYCANEKQMRHSLRRLLDYDFERMLFAHGTPIMQSARKKLEQLLRASD